MQDDPWGLLGHDWAAGLLRGHAAGGKIRHAYLFTGPQGVGRRTLALRLAQALNCPEPLAPAVPCRTCRACTLLERMAHPDLAVIQADQAGGVLKVESIRALQHSLSLAPYEARYRVALLLRFEEANPSASNALLKTLEEPPPQVVLILTAESAESLMPTIVSRCEVLRLRPLPSQELERGLQARQGLPAEQARRLALLSGGRPGYALRLLQEPELLERRQTWLEDQRRLLAAGRVERFAYAEALAREREALRGALLAWLSYWRDVMLRAGGAATPLANQEREEEIQALAAHLGLAAAHRMVSSLENTLALLERNVNPRLAAEVLLLDLPRLASPFEGAGGG